MHGMKQWPCLLFAGGVAVLGTSFFMKAKRVSVFTVLFYIVGFLAGMLFQTEGIDAGGGRTNNFWLIWTIVFVGGIVLAVASEGISAVKKRSD